MKDIVYQENRERGVMAALVLLEPILLNFFGGRSARRRKKKYAEEREGQVAKSYHTVRAPA